MGAVIAKPFGIDVVLTAVASCLEHEIAVAGSARTVTLSVASAT